MPLPEWPRSSSILIASRTTYGLSFPTPLRAKVANCMSANKARMQRNRDRSRQLWETGRGNELPNVRGTLWAAYNGVAEHADYGLTSARDSKWASRLLKNL